MKAPGTEPSLLPQLQRQSAALPVAAEAGIQRRQLLPALADQFAELERAFGLLRVEGARQFDAHPARRRLALHRQLRLQAAPRCAVRLADASSSQPVVADCAEPSTLTSRTKE